MLPLSPLRRIALLGTLLLLVLVGGARAQTATLRGVVTAVDDGEPLQGANVVLESRGGGIAYAASTGPTGFYEIEGIAPGTYPVKVSFVGFSTHVDTLDLGSRRRTYDVVLGMQETELGGVTVETERGAARRQAGLQTVGPSELSRIPMPGGSGDVVAYLQTLPGMVTGGDRGGQLYVRGGTPTQNLVLVDGLPIVKPFHISGMFSAFPEDAVKSADVYAGGYSAAYMGALSSVIDVSLRSGDKERYRGSASVSPFIATAHVEGPLKKNRSSFLGVVRHSIIEQTAPAIIGDDVPLQFYDMTGRVSLQADRTACSLTGLRTFDRGRLDNERDIQLSWTNTTAGGRCYFFSEDLGETLIVTMGHSRYENSAGSAAAPERSAGLAKTYFSVDRELGREWGSFDVGMRTDYATYSFVLDEKFIAPEAKDQYSYTLQGYAALDYNVGTWLTLSPSLGTNFSGASGQATLEPRFRMAVRPTGTDAQEISLAVGRYNQVAEGITDERDAGTVFTLWVPALQSDALPEARHGIIGYRKAFGTAVEASAEAYMKDMRNIPVPQWTPVARFNTRTTLADGLAYGADVRAEIDAEPVYLYLGYGWSKITYEAAGDNLGAWIDGELISYAPAHDLRHQFNAVMSYELGGFETSVRWEFGSGRPYTKVYGFDLALDLVQFNDHPATTPGTPFTLYDEPYGARLPTYHRLDISVQRRFDFSGRAALETQIGAQNLYDRSNIFYYDVNTLRRVDQTPLLPYLSLRFLVD